MHIDIVENVCTGQWKISLKSNVNVIFFILIVVCRHVNVVVDHLFIDPFSEGCDIGIHSRGSIFPTSDSPSHDTWLHVSVGLTLKIKTMVWSVNSKLSYLLEVPLDQLTGMGQTSGDPPSPLQVSFPGSPPAQMKVLCSSKCCPNLVFLKAVWHLGRWTIGNSTFLRMTWYLPSLPKTSLPHPEATHLADGAEVPAGGRQITPTFSASSTGESKIRTAISLNKPPAN